MAAAEGVLRELLGLLEEEEEVVVEQLHQQQVAAVAEAETAQLVQKVQILVEVVEVGVYQQTVRVVVLRLEEVEVELGGFRVQATVEAVAVMLTVEQVPAV